MAKKADSPLGSDTKPDRETRGVPSSPKKSHWATKDGKRSFRDPGIRELVGRTGPETGRSEP
jgi:hypothetical protein